MIKEEDFVLRSEVPTKKSSTFFQTPSAKRLYSSKQTMNPLDMNYLVTVLVISLDVV